MTYEVFELGDLALQSGDTLPGAKLAYKTYGQLSRAADNAVLLPTFFASQRPDVEAIYAGWVYSQEVYREREHRKMGLLTLDEVIQHSEQRYAQRGANDLLAMLWSWQRADISANARFNGDLDAALKAIAPRAIVMPGATDLYFCVRDTELEVQRMPNADLRPIPSIWGHAAGRGINADDNAFIDESLRELLRRARVSRASVGTCARQPWPGASRRCARRSDRPLCRR